uniref:8.9 kDa family member n=1 Tax=Rhipicephalus zambeziensis TaxID=60191 RepID=A0A224Y1B1_9ACAR
MIRFILLQGALHLVLVFQNVPGQLVDTYTVSTNSGMCIHNGSQYEPGENKTPGFCGMTFCDPDANELTIVNCSYTRPPPPSCVLTTPEGREYPKCCPDYIC